MEEMEEMPNSHFSIGQLVWAQSSKFPYWPCIVTLDNTEKIYKKFRNYGASKSIAIHVQYFGYNYSHNWVAERSLIPFTGLADFHKLAEAAKCKVKVKNGNFNPYRVKSVIRGKWNLAVDQATKVLAMKNNNGMKSSNIQVETKNSEHATTKTGDHCQIEKCTVASVVRSKKRLEYEEPSQKSADYRIVCTKSLPGYKDSNMKYKAVKQEKILELKDCIHDSPLCHTSTCQEIKDIQETGQLSDDEEKRDRRFAIGDLAWAQVRTYPYWPCVIVLDKKEKLYTKFRKYGKVTTAVFHVQFFGDSNSHTWVSDRFMIPFTGLADFHKLAKISKCTISRKNRLSCNAYSPQPSLRGRWNHAIDEATEALMLTNEDRVELFNPRDGRAVHERIMMLWLDNKRQKRKRIADGLDIGDKRLKREMRRTVSSNNDSRAFDETVPRPVASPKMNTDTPPTTPPNDHDFNEQMTTVIRAKESELEEELLDAESYYTTNVEEIEDEQNGSLTDIKYKLRSTITWQKSQQQPPLVDSHLECNEVPFAQQKKVWTIAAKKKFFPYDLFYNTQYERVCRKCEKPGDLRKCEGPCRFYFHLSCDEPFDLTRSQQAQRNNGFGRSNREKKNMTDVERRIAIVTNEPFQCTDCLAGIKPDCLICNRHGVVDKVICSASHCERNYHGKCLITWPQSYWQKGRLTCPRHTCHTCTAIHPQNDIFKFAKDELVRCSRCPSAYHTATSCIPAGSIIESNSLEIICAKHFAPADPLISADWCFICKRGGSLVRCDTCPKSAHLKCLGMKSSHGHFACKNCKYGRLPVYGEIVWVKLKKFRWWPARICLPHHELPESLYTTKRDPGEFGVNFLGTVNFQWVHRSQVFPYENGDSNGEIASNYGERNVDGAYAQALKEAKDLHESFKIERQKARSFVEDEEIGNLSTFYKFN